MLARRKAALRPMIFEAAATAAGAGAMHALAHRAILRGLRAPRLAHAHAPADVGLPAALVREVRIAGPRGRNLFGWLVLPPLAFERPVPAVLAMHGWGANASLMLSIAPPLHAAGFAVLLIDARCHGRSGDEAFTSMLRFAEDIAAGLAWLRTQPGIAPGQLALLGHSVGAAAALLHAAQHRHEVRAVVSLSAFAHPTEVMRRFLAEKRVPYPVLGWAVMRHVQHVIGASFDEIAPLATLAQVACPVLLVHGRSDTTAPFSDALRLQSASARATLLPVDGDHDLREALAPHAATLLAFLRTAFDAPPAAPPARSTPTFNPSPPETPMNTATDTPRPIHDELALLAEWVPLAGLNIVELGCGDASLARRLLLRHPDSQVTGLEVDARQHAKNLAAGPQPGLHFVAAGAQAIPFPDASFDLALMLKSLHHVPLPLMAQALGEAARVLRAGGQLYVSEPVYDGAFNELIRLFNDERTVRAAAQAALDAALLTGVWEQAAERCFEMPVHFRDFAEFEQRMLRPSFADHRIDDAKLAQVRAAFEQHCGADGARFMRPMHARLLRRRA